MSAATQIRVSGIPGRRSVPGICRYLKASERERLWGMEIPTGMRLGWTCDVAYCGKPEHFTLIENKNRNDRNYREIRDQLWGLKDGEFFDLPDEPNDEKSRLKFRAGLGMIGPRFLLRSLPRSKGVRIIRYGEHYDGQGIHDSLRAHPIIVYARKGGRKPWNGFYLGFLSGAPSRVGDCLPRCEVKGCPYAALRGTTCRAHSDSRIHAIYSRTIDKRDMLVPVEYPYMPLTLYRSRLGFDKKGFLNTTTVKDGRYVKKSSAEIMNDKWWKENVVLKGLLDDSVGVIQPGGIREIKVDGEADADTSIANICAFFKTAEMDHDPVEDSYTDESFA